MVSRHFRPEVRVPGGLGSGVGSGLRHVFPSVRGERDPRLVADPRRAG